MHRRIARTKSTGRGQDPNSRAGRQSDGCGGWGSRTKWKRTKWYGQNGMDKMVYGQNGIGQNGTDKMVRTKWYR